MNLFSNSLITLAKQNCMDTLQEIALNLESGQICSADSFMAAIGENDPVKVNQMLDKALEKYTGEKNIIFGLRTYCEKFDIPVTEHLADEKDMLLLIVNNAAQIEAKLVQQGIGK